MTDVLNLVGAFIVGATAAELLWRTVAAITHRKDHTHA